MVNLFDPYDPYMTFEAKPLIKLVANNILVILIKLHDHATWSVGVAFWKFWKYDTFWPLTPLDGGRMTRSQLAFLKLSLLSTRWQY